MDAVRALVAADLRRRWRSWLALALVVGVTGGVATASFAGWRRTVGAMDRFVAYTRPVDVHVEGDLDRDQLEALPGVAEASAGGYLLMVPVDEAGRARPEQVGGINPFSFEGPGYGRAYERPIVVDGRLADPRVEREVVVDEELAATYGVEAGGTLTMAAYGVDQGAELFEDIGRVEPTGPRFTFDVVGVIRQPADVVTKPTVPDVVHLGSKDLHLGAAFDAAHRDRDVLSIGGLFGEPSGSFDVVLRDGADREAFADAVRSVDPDAAVYEAMAESLVALRDAERAIDLQATALLAFGVLVSVAGVLLAGQAIRRQSDAQAEVTATWRALGMAPRSIAAVAVTQLLVTGAAGGLVAAALAVVLSPLAPVGYARRAEIDPGVHLDALVLPLGAVAVLAFVVVRGAVPALRAARRRGPGRATGGAAGEWAVRVHLPAPVVTGARAAGRQPGGRTVIGTVAVAAVGVVAGAGFAASERNLADDPTMWGWTWDVVVGDGNDPTLVDREIGALLDDPEIADVAALHVVDGLQLHAGERSQTADGVALDVRRGSLGPRLLEGAPPGDPQELALGAATAAGLGVGPGDEVEVEGQAGSRAMTVSGIAVFNLGLGADRIGEGAVVTPDAAARLAGDAGAEQIAVRYAPGADPATMLERLQARFGLTVLPAVPPLDVEQLDRVRHLPVAFSLLVAGTAALVLAFVLTLTVRRSRRDLALLRTLGFVRGQLRATVAAQATVLVVPAAVVGALLGVVIGRLAWTRVAEDLGAPVVPVVPLSAAALFVAGAVLLGNAIAALPGRAAGATRPAAVLRAE